MLVIKYRGVVFDDFNTFEEHGKVYNFWSQICTDCVKNNKEIIKTILLDDCGQGICGVEGCTNEADYYIDFPPKEVDIYNNKTVSE